MKLKKIIAILLSVILVISGVPMLVGASGTKSMLHIVESTTSTSSDVFVLKTNSALEPGKEYTVSFDSAFVSGSLGGEIIFGIFGNAKPASGRIYGDILRATNTGYGTAFSKTTREGNNIQYTFTLNEDEIDDSGRFFAGFYFSRTSDTVFDFYLSDFVLYESTDKTKTNLLSQEVDATTMGKWYRDYGSSAEGTTEFAQNVYTATLLSYDASVFALPETMLHVVRTSTGGQRLIQKLPANVLEEGVEYTISFNYNFVNGALNSGVYVGLFGETATDMKGDAFIRASRTSFGCKNTFAEDDNGVNVKYTFTLNEGELTDASYTDYYVGFYYVLNETVEFYISDFVMYASSDAQKTNLLRKNSSSTTLDDWYNNYNSGTSITSTSNIVEYVEYDASMFTVYKTMLHIARSSTGENKLVQRLPSGILKEGVEYTLSFDYKFVSGGLNNGVYVGLFGETDAEMNADAPIRASRNSFGCSDLFGETDDGINVKYTFTLAEGELTNAAYTDIYVGLYYKLSQPAELYMADLVMYESSDSAKVNLLSKDEYSNTLSGWYNNYNKGSSVSSTGSLAEYVEYNKEYFARPKTMLHVNRSSSGQNRLVQKLPADILEEGVEYTISFDYNFVSGGLNNGVYVGLFGETDADMYADAPIRASRTAFGCSDLFGETDDGINVKYTFTLSDGELTNAAYTDIYVGFYFTNPAKFYVGDLVMYKSADAKKTNILLKNEHSTDMTGWYNNYNNGAGENYPAVYASSQYVPYDESYFTPPKTMLHVKTAETIGNDETLLQHITALEAGKEYTLSFKYRFENGAFDNDLLRIGLFGYNGTSGMKWDKVIRGNLNAFDQFTSFEYDGVNAALTFTLTEEEVAAYTQFSIGFYFYKTSSMITEFYIADMVMYETADADKTNVLFHDEYADNTDGWYRNWGKASAATGYTVGYEAYIPEYFEMPEEIVLYGDIHSDNVIDIRDLVALKKSVINLVEYSAVADINDDNSVDSIDLILLRKHLLGTEPIEWNLYMMTFDAISGGADEKATALKADIMAVEDTEVTGTIYYVSASGNDDNTGKSANDALKTVAAVNALELTSGDAVLFNRGDVFRTAESLSLTSGVHYGAYGEGDKPQILGSIMNYADSSIWSSEDGKVWQTSVSADDVGNIVFNDGEASGVRRESLENLIWNGDFYFDSSNGILYLYFNICNPGDIFDSIEIATTNSLLHYAVANCTGISIENLCLKYAAVAGIVMVNSTNVKISGCEIGWCGGGYNGTTRYGNAIELYQNASDCVVTDNYIYQIYDAAITFQGGTSKYSNLTFSENLIEYCSMNFEFWSSGSLESGEVVISDIEFSNNILRFGGYGFGGRQRTNERDKALVLCWNYEYADGQIQNVDITGNIFDTANCNFFYATASLGMLNISGNEYYQQAGSYFEIVRGSKAYASDQDSFATAIAAVDQAATVVSWISE